MRRTDRLTDRQTDRQRDRKDCAVHSFALVKPFVQRMWIKMCLRFVNHCNRYVGQRVNISLYGEGYGLIWLSNVNCNGTERYISECSHDAWGMHYCGHHQDVAISCTNDTSGNYHMTIPCVSKMSARFCSVILCCLNQCRSFWHIVSRFS